MLRWVIMKPETSRAVARYNKLVEQLPDIIIPVICASIWKYVLE
jgi:hypothetical protein